MKYFNYEKVARDAGIPREALVKIRQIFRKEYPRDEMLYELHVLRACMAVRDGLVTIDEVLATPVVRSA